MSTIAYMIFLVFYAIVSFVLLLFHTPIGLFSLFVLLAIFVFIYFKHKNSKTNLNTNILSNEENALVVNSDLHKKSTMMLYIILVDAIFLILSWFGSRQIIGVFLIAAIILSIFIFFASIINFILGVRKLKGTNSDTHAFILFAILGACMFFMSAFILLLHAAAGLGD